MLIINHRTALRLYGVIKIKPLGGLFMANADNHFKFYLGFWIRVCVLNLQDLCSKGNGGGRLGLGMAVQKERPPLGGGGLEEWCFMPMGNRLLWD